MNRKRLPVGTQDFTRLRTTNSYYVDKTSLIRELIESGDHYFLSRPRRFGKSLLLSTMKALFEGQEDLFRGLDIDDHWDWSITSPVVRLSFDGKYNESGEIEHDVMRQLASVERRYGVSPDATSVSGALRLSHLLEQLHHQTGQQVAVLVDEYDKPILDVLRNPDLATANRDYLRGFYGMLKGCAEHIRFVFVTGVSMFSKVSLFSGLNNLEDISLDRRFATICGYTDNDIDTVFAPELDGVDRDKIRHWYNGYNWLGTERVYNPFDVLLFFRHKKFDAHWFETATPEFLFEKLMEQAVSLLDLENQTAEKSVLSTFDVHDISVPALMFQTGYFTISEEVEDGGDTLFRLDYPNLEVKKSLSNALLTWLVRKTPASLSHINKKWDLRDRLKALDFEGFRDVLQGWFSAIPYQWQMESGLAQYEAWYQCLITMCFRALGTDVRVEEASSHGRSDLVVMMDGHVFVFEFKMAARADDVPSKLTEALAQIRERGYADKYRHEAKSIHFIGVVCGADARNILELQVEEFRQS